MRIAITGATGYIGQRLVRAARFAGHEVLALSRRPFTEPGVAWQAFDLANTQPLQLPADVAMVFHLAVNTQHDFDSEDVEPNAAQRLIDAAAVVGASFVFVSSQAAGADAPTAYGRIKWQIEGKVLASGGWVVRPGQVYGGPELGLFGLLCRLVRHLPVLPAFLPTPYVQPVHVDDLVDALLASPAQAPSTVLCIAAVEGVGFTTFLQAIARGRTNRRPICMPVPTLAIRILVALFGARLSARLGLERLLSLFALKPMDTAGDLQRVSVSLRPLGAGMTRSGCGRRELLAEGRAFLTYVLRIRPADALVRRYARAIEALKAGRVLPLPGLMLRLPTLLALLDGAAGIDDAFRREFAWRVDAALMVAEASPQGAGRFLGLDRPGGRFRGMLRIFGALSSETIRRIVQLVLRPFLSRVGRRGAL
ncbi:SDR family oxidoreductase [Pseudomonas sp. KCJK8993]|uniref:SDR family oxidoreductase n=1 Tax=Pseudomonas sp. KCJK8993 TaxID=3344565 RepID=UPI0039068755